MKYIYSAFAMCVWIAGIVIAKGFWSTLFAVCIPFWAWYLVIEKALYYFGVL